MRWPVLAFLLVLLCAMGLRYGTTVLERDAVFDEPWIRVPIEALLMEGWTVERAIDFKETKGPALIWTYALLGEVVGSELNDLRLVSLLFFVVGVVPLLLIARRAGLGGPDLLLVAGFYVLLPHNAVLGQLLMSEPSFMFGALWLVWVFLWGLGDAERAARPVAGPVLFFVILSILLHLRVHAVAFAGAAVLVAFERDRWRSWPWVLACAAAGLSRVPLWLRWGGLVAPEYESMHGLGFDLDSLTYLAAAWIPFIAVFIGRAIGEAPLRPPAWIGGCAGALLSVLGPASPADTVFFGGRSYLRFQGFISTGVRALVPEGALRTVAVGALAVAGAASMGALAGIAWKLPAGSARGVIVRFLVLTLLVGSCTYVVSRGYVFDRYLAGWAILLPVVWVACLPRVLQAAQAAALAGILAYLAWKLL